MDNGETSNIVYTRRSRTKQNITTQKTKKTSNQDPIKIRVNTGAREESVVPTSYKTIVMLQIQSRCVGHH